MVLMWLVIGDIELSFKRDIKGAIDVQGRD